MKDLDKELEEILKPLRNSEPTDIELQKWKSAALREQRAFAIVKSRFPQSWLRFVAAGVVGFVIGWAVFGSSLLQKADNKDLIAEANKDATVEFVFIN